MSGKKQIWRILCAFGFPVREEISSWVVSETEWEVLFHRNPCSSPGVSDAVSRRPIAEWRDFLLLASVCAEEGRASDPACCHDFSITMPDGVRGAGGTGSPAETLVMAFKAMTAGVNWLDALKSSSAWSAAAARVAAAAAMAESAEISQSVRETGAPGRRRNASI